MRLSQILREFLGAREYQPPQDAQTLMADFYMVQMLQQPDIHYPSHLKDEQDYELKQIEKVLLPQLKEHLLIAAGHSIFSETTHFIDQANLSNSGSSIPLTSERATQVKVKFLKQHLPKRLARDLLDFYREGADEYMMDRHSIASYCAVAELGLQVFSDSIGKYQIGWEENYGGEAWLECCTAWLRLYQAQTSTDITMACDRIYDLQHNTGQLLDKNEEYEGEWVQELLDLKFEAAGPQELLPLVSPLLRKLAQAYTRYFHKPEPTAEPEAATVADVLKRLCKILEKLQLIVEPVPGKPDVFAMSYLNTYTGGEEVLFTLRFVPPDHIEFQVNQHTDWGRTIGNDTNYFEITDLKAIQQYLKGCVEDVQEWWDKPELRRQQDKQINDYLAPLQKTLKKLKLSVSPVSGQTNTVIISRTDAHAGEEPLFTVKLIPPNVMQFTINQEAGWSKQFGKLTNEYKATDLAGMQERLETCVSVASFWHQVNS